MERRAFEWLSLLQQAEAGDCAPLADALRGADPADVPRDVLAFAADVMSGKTPPRKRGPKARADRAAAELTYLGLRAHGTPAVLAVDEIARRFALSRSAAYALLGRVLTAGDKLARLSR
jgi:hypothetical protein